jgi:hypothetical protein
MVISMMYKGMKKNNVIMKMSERKKKNRKTMSTKKTAEQTEVKLGKKVHDLHFFYPCRIKFSYYF